MPDVYNRADDGAWISQFIKDFVKTSPQNQMGLSDHEPIWEEPLVGFANGADPVFVQIQNDVGDFYWTPSQIFNLTFPDQPAKPRDLTVISWILPQTSRTKEENTQDKIYPSERWTRGKFLGKAFIAALQTRLIEELREAGAAAVAPSLSPLFAQRNSPKYSYASNWSERHAAYACGLGTFGLCDGLITPFGKAMRTGSVIARLFVPPTDRPYTDHNAYCLFYTHGTCKKCVENCPANAISEAGHDKEKCRRFLRGPAWDHSKKNYGLDEYTCGKCQVDVPCSSHIPVLDEG